MRYSRHRITADVREALRELFVNDKHDPTYEEIVEQMLGFSPGKGGQTLTNWVHHAVTTLKLRLWEEGVVLLQMGLAYYRDEEEGWGAGRKVPSDPSLLIQCCRPPYAGVFHCTEPSPFLEFANAQRVVQLSGMVNGFGQRLQEANGMALLGPESKKLLKTGGFKFQLNG